MLWIILGYLLFNNPVFAIEATPSATVIINKFQYNPPLDKNEWVELYNLSDSEIDLNGWQLVDESNTKKLLTGKKIGGKSNLLFEDGKSWLNNDFDTVFLKVGESIIDSAKYKITGKKISVNDVTLDQEYSDFKGKWLGRTDVGSTNWQVFTDTDGPSGGAINYFDGYKNIIEKISVGITVASDFSGIGSTNIVIKMANLTNNSCDNFVVDIGNSLGDGKCYKYEYVAIDGVGNSSIFSSNFTVKFDTTKPIISINSAFRNILKIKSEFFGTDPESGIAGYSYKLDDSEFKYTGNNILNIGYSGEPKSICGKAVNNSMLESEISCSDFVIDVIAPKIINQNNLEKKKYKIGDKLKFSFEFGENIETTGNSFLVKLNTGDANFFEKVGNILNFEYIVVDGDLTNNLAVGETKIMLNGGDIYDLAGNSADLTISNLEEGIIIDGVKPTIGLIGESYVEVPQFGIYLDLGVTVSDGIITNLNDVNTMLGGIYQYKYIVTDEAGNTNNIVRNIKVIDTTAPTINQLSVTSLELSINSDEDGYVEWQGKCDSENKNINTGDNKIVIKNVGDGIYDNCKIRMWDKWGNVGEWQVIDSFMVDTTAPIISFVNSSQTEISIVGNENLKSCTLEKEKIMSGDFESGNIDGWSGEWMTDNLHFANGGWSARSPNLVNEDLVEKSMWQTINMESDGILSYWWRVSSEKDWDFLKFYVDNILISKISGEVAWHELKHNLAIGTHVIKFTYSKDYSGESGEDAGWIDEIKVVGGGTSMPMTVTENKASAEINNLEGGVTKYKVSCIDFYNNKSSIIETSIVKSIEKIITPTPTPYTIFKTSAIVPTIKITKTPTVKVAKKSPAVLGIATTPTPNLTNTPPPTTKLKTNIPWTEIQFWAMGMMVLGGTSGVILLDKRVN